MKAMILSTYGETAEFRSTEMEKPYASTGQVVVRVAASSVNTMIRQMENIYCYPLC